jgi:hypothetical protein
LCQVMDKILVLEMKDEYEMAANALENVLFNIVHMRPLIQKTSHLNTEFPVWSREEFQWGQIQNLDDLTIEWYIPGEFVEIRHSPQLCTSSTYTASS